MLLAGGQKHRLLARGLKTIETIGTIFYFAQKQYLAQEQYFAKSNMSTILKKHIFCAKNCLYCL